MARVEKPLGPHLLAREHDLARLSQHELERERGRSDRARLAQCLAQLARELVIAYRFGGDGVPGTLHRRISDGALEEINEVADVDPAHPLLAVSNGAAHSGAKDRQELLERASPAAQHDSDADRGSAQPGRS